MWSKREPHSISATQEGIRRTEITTRRKELANKVIEGRKEVVDKFLFSSVASHVATELSLFKTQTVLVYRQVKPSFLSLKVLVWFGFWFCLFVLVLVWGFVVVWGFFVLFCFV